MCSSDLYVRRLEALLIEVLDGFGIAAGVVPGRPGVWAEDAKVAAIGVAVRGGITRHGFALNVAPDLSWFADIVPCGIADAGVTSIERLNGEAPPMSSVLAATARAFERLFECRLEQPSVMTTGVGVDGATV